PAGDGGFGNGSTATAPPAEDSAPARKAPPPSRSTSTATREKFPDTPKDPVATFDSLVGGLKGVKTQTDDLLGLPPATAPSPSGQGNAPDSNSGANAQPAGSQTKAPDQGSGASEDPGVDSFSGGQ